jgi:hypothetical protein
MAVRWFVPDGILAMADGQMVSPTVLRPIVFDSGTGRRLPLETAINVT